MNDPAFRGKSAFDPAALERLADETAQWEQGEVARFIARASERKAEFRTLGGFPLKRTYTALDVADTPLEDIGLPGRYPFTRGPYPTMYRGRFWTMRQIAGFGTAEDTNKRFHYLIAQGQTGLSIDFDMPTLMGFDSDHPMSEGEVGREGVAIDTMADMELPCRGVVDRNDDILRAGLPLEILPAPRIHAEKRHCDPLLPQFPSSRSIPLSPSGTSRHSARACCGRRQEFDPARRGCAAAAGSCPSTSHRGR